MLHSYDEIYTAKAQTSLAQMLRYAEEDMHIELNEFWDMFLISGVADLFGKGDFRFLVGMSSDVLDRLDFGVVPVVLGAEFQEDQ